MKVGTSENSPALEVGPRMIDPVLELVDFDDPLSPAPPPTTTLDLALLLPPTGPKANLVCPPLPAPPATRAGVTILGFFVGG